MRVGALLALIMLAGCDGALLAERTVVYREAEGPVPSPGRGFLRFAALADADLGWIHATGDTLIYSPIRLDPRRDALPDGLEAALEAGFARARAEGLTVVARAVYNDGFEGAAAPDAPLDRMQGHIAALGPILSRNADVILAVQAGLIGAWGEWHGSASGHGAAARRAVVEGWLDALPPSVAVQVRTPAFKVEATGREAPGAADRIGHHNDCFLSSETDVGTYPPGQLERWLDWLAADTRATIFGGETCALHPRNTCPAALDEMARLRVSFLNRGWHPDVIQRWRNDGCLDEIEARLGYRLVLEEATWVESLPRGDRLNLAVALRNAGFAPPRRPWLLSVFVVDGADRVAARWPAEVDLRTWRPGNHRLMTSAALDLPPGRYAIELGAWHMPDGMHVMPDGMPARQGLRFANRETWRPASGRNRLGAVEIY